MSLAATNHQDASTRALYEKLEDRILARDQIGASESYYRLVLGGRPLAEMLREAVRIHGPYTHVPYHERIDDGFVNFVNNDHCLLSARATLNISKWLPAEMAGLPMAQTIWYIPTGLDARGVFLGIRAVVPVMQRARRGGVRLTGFGIASRLRRERPPPDPPEVIAGTLAYMAPEQTGRMKRSVDSRSDLYSLGVTLYEMLAGSLPFSRHRRRSASRPPVGLIAFLRSLREKLHHDRRKHIRNSARPFTGA